MKYTKIIILTVFSLWLSSSVIFGSETPSTGLTSWAQNQLYSFYQGMINSFPILQIPQSIAATISEWNDKTKAIVSTTIIASLLSIYRRKEIAEWISDLIVRPTKKTKKQRSQFIELPWDQDYEKKITEFLKK
jgi:hypothetical protein